MPAVAILLRGVLLVLLQLFQSRQQFFLQGLGHIQDTVGLLGLGLFQDERGLAALAPVREGVIHLIGVEFFQSVLILGRTALASKSTVGKSKGLASRLCSDLKSQKGELPSPAGTERISKNM